jgi:broad specificity phosphatase PhoE
VTHPEVVVNPQVPVERWHLSDIGIARMRIFARSRIVHEVKAVWASTETKAIEAAGILGGALGCGVGVLQALGENDRRSTGFLPPAEFEAVADQFFREPHLSVRGWERAIDAQARVLNAARAIVEAHVEGDLAIVAHGAVGTLLYSALSGNPIARSFDQAYQGHYWIARLPEIRPDEGWKPIAPRS